MAQKLSGREITLNMLCAGDTRGLDDACKVMKLNKQQTIKLLITVFICNCQKKKSLSHGVQTAADNRLCFAVSMLYA